MSKIICEVCGTSYPETASQCPICGSAKPADAPVSMDEAAGEESAATSTYTYVKGGRFSKANVRKRNKANKNAVGRREEVPPERQRKKGGGSNRALSAVAVILVLAIIAVIIYIGVRFFLPAGWNPFAKQDTKPTVTLPQAQTQPTEQDLSCTDLVLPDTQVILDAVGDNWRLGATPTPVNTTDKIVYTSSDPSVATVTEDGMITAVSGGQATITVTCGSVSRECLVICEIQTETEPTEPPTEATTLPDLDLVLNREDFTLSSYGEQWQLFDDWEHADLITWISDDTDVCTIEKGVVTAVGFGTTTVYGEYNGEKASCIVRCYF